MGAFAAAGDGLGSLASSLASSQVNSAKQLASVIGSNWQQWQQAMGTNAGVLASLFAQGADKLAAAAVGGIDQLSNVAGAIDDRGEALHAVRWLGWAGRAVQGRGQQLEVVQWQFRFGWGGTHPRCRSRPLEPLRWLSLRFPATFSMGADRAHSSSLPSISCPPSPAHPSCPFPPCPSSSSTP